MFRKKKIKVLGCVIGLTVLGAYFLPPIASDYFDMSMCVDEVQGEFTSPDRAFVATVFERGCGATVSGSSKMVIMRESTHALRISRSGEIKFPHSYDPQQEQDVILIADGEQDISPYWHSNNVLELSVSSGEKFKSSKSWQNINIRYK